MSDCPLRLAAQGAPKLFGQLDKLADLVEIKEGECLTLPATPTVDFIAKLFGVWRKGGSLFPINPKIPNVPNITHAPPQSLLLLTSGSTGAPKVALLSRDNLLANASGAIPALDLRPEDHWLLSLPLYHVGGIGIILRCVLARAAIALQDSPNITHLSYVPTQLYRATPIYKHLRCLLLGGAPIHNAPKHLPIYTTYGLTEMGSMVALNGNILPNREVKIGSDGEILVRGSCLFKGYLNEPPITDWFHTKDLGRFENGKLTILGRKDWMFISGGENIQPEEIESALLSLPHVQEAVVVAKEDAEFGKRPVAIICASHPYTLEEIRRALLPHLPKYKIPIDLYLADEIPKKNNFKINRFILSQYVNSQLDKNTSGQKKLPCL